MPDREIKILCTRPVDNSLTQKALTQHIRLDTLSFIATEPIQTIEVQQEIEQAALQVATVIFTSMNAVEAVTDTLDGHVPEWQIYCIGHTTKQLVETYFGTGTVTGSADSAAELADLIIENNDAEEVIFFCGNKRRDDLLNKLQDENIIVNEIVVYLTKDIQHRVAERYDAILFFSPSAAESFFKINNPVPECILFAIGNTTRKTIEQFCENKIIVSKSPGKDMLVEQALTYFNQ